MVLTAEQKSLFLFEELMNSYGVDLENVESESKGKYFLFHYAMYECMYCLPHVNICKLL